MEMQSRLRIGERWVDCATNEIGQGEDAVRVEPKAIEVLRVLAEHAGRVVSRNDLLAAVWPGVVVGDEALTQTIIKLRRALGDNPRSPAYIETISKRGYRLIASVAGAEGGRLAHPLRALALATGVLVAFAAAAAYFLPDARDSVRIPFEAADGTRAQVLTVAVLPFEAVGAESAHEYLAHGMSSDLMTYLARLPGLRLIGPPGAGARYLISGTVQRQGATLRINLRLTDTRTREQVWSQRFERSAADLLAVQSEISRSVAEQLPARIGEAERRRIEKRYTSSAQAYDIFLHAQALVLVRGREENREARALYRKALELDPKFARAYAGLALTYAMDYRYGAPSPVLARALELADTARQVDPSIPEVYWTLGFIHTQSRQYEQALHALGRAVELNPSYADAYALMGGIYTYVGEAKRSIPLLRIALRLNPEGGYLYYLLLGRAYLFEGDIEQALINLHEAHERNAADLETRIYLAAALAARGERSAAQWEAEEIRAQDRAFSLPGWLTTYPMTDAGYRARLSALLAKVPL